MPAPVKYDLLLSGARVIDPSQGIDAVREVAVRDGLVAAVSEGIDPRPSPRPDRPVRAHPHPRVDRHPRPRVRRGDHLGHQGGRPTASPPGSRRSSTPAVPAGPTSSASRSSSPTGHAPGPLTFVHISGIGLTYGPVGEMEDLRYGDPERTACVIHNWPEICVGVKVRQARFQVGDNGVEPLRLATEAAGMVGVPVMVHIGTGVPLPEVLAGMRGGDIVTHCYQGHGDLVIGEDDRVLESRLGGARARRAVRRRPRRRQLQLRCCPGLAGRWLPRRRHQHRQSTPTASSAR